MKVNLTVNGQEVAVEQGAMVLEAVNQTGALLPQLCKDPDQSQLGTCRTCLVKIEGVRGTPASCQTLAEEGMHVSTHDEDVLRIRNAVLQLTIDMIPESQSDHLGEFGRYIDVLDITPGRFKPATTEPRRESIDSSNPIWELDRTRCILCQRCIAACQDVQHIYAIAMLNTGAGSEIGTFRDGPLIESNCTSCGQCWSVCPTLAIRQKQPALLEGVPST